jgi:hypothetical protein
VSEEFPTDHGAKSPGDPGKDLFGEPASPYRDPRGRKKLKLTNDLRDKVAVLRAAGMDRQDIADAIGCCKRTLETYFLPSLNEGRAAKRAEAIARLYQLGVVEGNVSALKAYIAMTERADYVPDVPGKSKTPKLGKKEQLAADAQMGHQESGWGELLH